MSLIYLITRLPKLQLGEPPPITRAELIRRARSALEGSDLVEFERVAMLEEVEETVRALNRAEELKASGQPVELAPFVRTERSRTALDRAARDLPEWVLEPAPQHLLLRRYWQHLIVESKSDFARDYANFTVDVEEASTALCCQREALSRADFLEQMSGRFDLSSRVIIDHYDDADLGIGGRFAWWPRLMAAFNERDRLEAERAIDRLRFETIERIKGIATFSIDVVLASYFQLRIIERESSWDYEQGVSTLNQILTIPALEQAIGAAT
jgi:hypothetical protein